MSSAVSTIPTEVPEASAPEVESVPVTVIEPHRGWAIVDYRALWEYRDLFRLLVWRDIAARYRQSVVGYGWAVVKPVLSMLIFTFVFGRLVGVSSDGAPYAIFAFSALLPWMYFAGALTGATDSVVGGAGLLRKVYFPRLILPLTRVVTGLVELAIQLVVLGLLMVYFEIVPSWQFLMLPVFILGAVLTALSVGIWLTAINVKYRDVGQAVPFLVQAWMWLSPVVYPSSSVPEHLRVVYGLNPMVGVIEGFRWSILGTTTPDWPMLAVSFGVVGVLLLTGLMFFSRVESKFADVI